MILLLATLSFQDPATGEIQEKYRALRPRPEELGIYQLDWAPNLKEAQERAAREGRPIFLIVVTNSYGDMFSGHC